LVAEIPDDLMAHLSAEGAHVLFTDAAADPLGAALLPKGPAVSALHPPLSLIAVPLAYSGTSVGVLAAVAGADPQGFRQSTVHSFEALAVEVSLAVTSTRLLQQERDSYRFMDRLREVGRTLSMTFDQSRLKQTLCEQSVALFSADAAQFWDADPE